MEPGGWRKLDELKDAPPPGGIRPHIINVLRRLSKADKADDFEWTDTRIAVVLFFWIWSLAGVGIAIYGMVRYLIMDQQDAFRFILLGIGITIAGNILVGIAGKILSRKKSERVDI